MPVTTGLFPFKNIPVRISENFLGPLEQNFPVEWTRVENEKPLFRSLGIFQWLRDLNRKYRSKQNTDKSKSSLLINHNSRDLIQTVTAAKTSQNKGFKEWYNGCALVINLRTFYSQSMQNHVHHRDIFFIGMRRFRDEASIYRQTEVARFWSKILIHFLIRVAVITKGYPTRCDGG